MPARCVFVILSENVQFTLHVKKEYTTLRSTLVNHSRKQFLKLIIYVKRICMTTIEQVAVLLK